MAYRDHPLRREALRRFNGTGSPSQFLTRAQPTFYWDARTATVRTKTGAVSITAAGNEITDVVRAAALSGDALGRDDSYGVWQSSTNLIANGAFVTNTTGWTPAGTNTIERVTAASEGIPTLFGTHVGKLTFQNSQFGAAHALTVPGAGTYSGSVWVYIPTSYDGTDIRVFFNSYTGSSAVTNGAANMALRDQWQRISGSRAIVGGDLAGDLLVYDAVGAPTAGRHIYICGAQAEATLVSTPYIATDGSTASRSAARVQIPATLDETQGWIAMRMRLGWGITRESGLTVPVPFVWGDASNTKLILFYLESTNGFTMRRDSAGTGTGATATYSVSNAGGGFITIIGRWTATQMGISLDGAAFTDANNNTIPTLSATSFDIGGDAFNSNRQINADILWVAGGKGTLTNRDAALIHSQWQINPRPEDLALVA